VRAKNDAGAALTERVLVITRVLDAPRALVYAAWTEPERLLRWWGPHGFTVDAAEVDVRVGGAWRVRMRSPEGEEHTSSGVYRELVPPERLVFTFAWEGCEDGEPGHETLVSLSFAEEGGRTRMTFRQEVFTSVPSRDAHEGGWSEAFERLAAHLGTR
jgi:uncharacterized protein YndB with AHSA1/START domain